MLIRMLKDQRGSVDGVVILPYLRGETYDMSKTKGHVELAETFLSQNWAIKVDDKQTQDSTSDRAGDSNRGQNKPKNRNFKR